MRAERKEVSFKRGSILTAEMLEAMAGFPLSLISGLTVGYEDGFISGFDVYNKLSESGKNDLVITPGLVKLNGSIYVMNDEYIINSAEYLSGKRYYCVLKKTKSSKPNENIRINALEMIVSDDEPDSSDMLFCEIKPNISGLSLPDTLADVNSDTAVKLNGCRYVSTNGLCLHPHLTRIVKDELRGAKLSAPEDYMLLGAVMTSFAVPVDVIKTYAGDPTADIEKSLIRLHERIEKDIKPETTKIENKSNRPIII